MENQEFKLEPGTLTLTQSPSINYFLRINSNITIGDTPEQVIHITSEGTISINGKVTTNNKLIVDTLRAITKSYYNKK